MVEYSYKKPKKYDRNLVVIGAGAAGLITSYIGATVKAKVTLIEGHKMGGDCLNTGCVPSKALIRAAKLLNDARRAHDYGLRSQGMAVDFAAVMERVQKAIKKIEPHDSIERYTDLGVECITGYAKLTSPYSVEVNGKELLAKNIVIATGARPFVPPIPGLQEVNYLTSDNVWNLRKLPPRLVVMGGGPIGCELAQSFARLGSKVTMIEMAPGILIREDQEVADLVEKSLLRDGVEVLTNHQVTKVAQTGADVVVSCETPGQRVSVRCDAILVAVGRAANTDGLGLKELGIELTERGTIKVNDYLQTRYPNILACGDVVGPYQFTHMAGHQAWYASVNALFRGIKKFKVDYSLVPAATYTDPEVARVGLNEQEAKQQNIPYEVVRYDLDDLDRAIVDGETQGFIKLLTVPGKDKLLGVTIVGHHAGDLIAEFVLAMKYGLGLNKILGTIHIYPTWSEATKLAAGAWKKEHVPEKVMPWLERFHKWRLG